MPDQLRDLIAAGLRSASLDGTTVRSPLVAADIALDVLRSNPGPALAALGTPAPTVRRRAVPEGMTPGKLRDVADWLDTFDRIAELVVLRLGGDTELDGAAVAAVRGKEVQAELRRWADALDDHRETTDA